jgi:alkylhydroperoxidase family enzyme
VIAEENGCGYCLSAHTEFGRRAGVDEDALARSRTGRVVRSQDRRSVEVREGGERGARPVSDEELAKVRAAGYDDADIAAIIGHVALNVFTNYFNRATHPVLDFPEVPLGMAKAA